MINLNVYDFDKTIYDGDSTIDFYFFCIKKQPQILKYVPLQTFGFIKYFLKICDKTELKQYFYSFLRGLKNTDKILNDFWDSHIKNIKQWYLLNQKDDDVIISASPEFLLKPACDKSKIKYLIASDVDINTGIYSGINCYGEEKVHRFKYIFGDVTIDEFYSDSISDLPLAEISEKSFLVKNNQITPWLNKL